MIVNLAAGLVIVFVLIVVLSANYSFKSSRKQLDHIIESFRELGDAKTADLLLLLDRSFNSHLSETLSTERAPWAWNDVQKERETRARIILEDMRTNIGCCLQLARVGLVERQSRSAEHRTRFEKVARDLVNAAAICQLRVATMQFELLSGVSLDTMDSNIAEMLQVVGERLVVEYHHLIENALVLCGLQGNQYRDALFFMVGSPREGSLFVMPDR